MDNRRIKHMRRGTKKKVFLSTENLIYTRDSEAFLFSKGRLSHYPNRHQIAKKSIGGIPFVQVEDEGTNEVTSSLLDNDWTKTNIETPVLTNDPLGNSGAWEVIPDAVNGEHSVSYAFTPDGSSSYCLMAVVKGNDYTWVQLELSAAGFPGTPNCYFNLSTGAVGTATNCDDSGIEVANGFYLIWITATSDAAASTDATIRVAEADTDNSFAGNSSDSMILWCPQAIKSAYPTSIIRNINLLTYSNTFRAAISDWNNTRCDIDDDALELADGTTADKFYFDSTLAETHFIRRYEPVVAGNNYTTTFEVKAGELTKININHYQGGLADTNDFVDLSDGSVYSSASDAISVVESGLVSGLYKISVTNAITVTENLRIMLRLCDDSYNEVCDGDGSSGVYVRDSQLELGAYPSSRIPTAGSSETRNGDQYEWSSAFVNAFAREKFAVRLIPQYSSTQNATDNYVCIWKTSSGDYSFYIDSSNRFNLYGPSGQLLQTAAVTWDAYSKLIAIVDTDNGNNCRLRVFGLTSGYLEAIGTAFTVSDGSLQWGHNNGSSQFGGYLSKPYKI
jgi:hypothetical protein